MNILLIDNHTLFREGLRHILRRLPGGVSKILEAGNFSDGLKLAGQHPALDLVLLELKTPGCEGAVSVKHFHLRYPHIQLVVVSSEEDRSVIAKALRHGANGFVCKSSTGAALLGALKLALSGSIHVPEQVLRQPDMPAESEEDRNDNRRSSFNESCLSARQMEILRCLVAGLSNREIARITNLAEGTVKAHVSAVYQILRVKNRMGAILAAKQLDMAGPFQA